VLAYLLTNGYRGKVNLIYIDPPFNTGVDYVRKVVLRGIKMEKLSGEEYSFAEQIQYANSWYVDAYLQFLYERLQLAKEVLANDGIIFIRLDVHFGYYLRMIADEVFGQDMFQNEIIVNRIKKNVTEKGKRTIPHAVDYLYVYFKGSNSEYKNVLRKLPETKPGYWHNMDSPGIPGPRKLLLGGKTYFPSPGAHLKFTQAQAEEMWANNLIREHPKSGNLEYWVKDKDFENLDSNWTGIPGYAFTTGYPTENAEQLLERVILAGSKPNDIVLDFFIGSGTTAAAAQKLGRRWIGCDINKGAIQTTSKRLQKIILEQAAEARQGKLDLGMTGDGKKVTPALSFNHYRINDYDLQLQHNEALELALEHVGVTRLRTDSFFEGTLGKKLVKVVPLVHPCTLLDVQLVENELKNRPEEARDVVMIALGCDANVDAYLSARNKNKPVNKVELIELRTDPKYRTFFTHQPAWAHVAWQRKDKTLRSEITDFSSPTILQRLAIDETIFRERVTDFRALIDVVLIDTDYNGEVFNIHHADVPEKKTDFVKAKYELPIESGKRTIAVKIIDMLGEEVLITKEF
jgi:DNA modification methylase